MLSTICSTDINNQQLYNVHQTATLLQPQNIKLWHKITTHSINHCTKLGHTETNIGKARQRGHLIDINTQAGKKSHGICSCTLKPKACLFGFKLCIQSLKYTNKDPLYSFCRAFIWTPNIGLQGIATGPVQLKLVQFLR